MSNPGLTLKLARQYSPIFAVPVSTLMAIADIESSHDPSKVNMDVAAKGGAWGLMQQMLDEAPWKIQMINGHEGKLLSSIKKVTKRFDGTGKSLLDPELSMVLGAWQLGQLTRAFGDFNLVAAAYHQGKHAVEKRLAEGKPAVSKKQPKGLAYVAMANAAREKYLPIENALAFAE
jgi:soluble lytic murein transglycosylase-like protein